MEFMNFQQRNEETYIKKVYQYIILLGLFAHVSYIIIFAFLSFYQLAFYNIASVCFYGMMLITAHKEKYRLTVSSIHIEVCLFVIISTLMGGWNLGIYFYLIALSSLVYFCPFRHKYVPYLFSITEVVIFIVLRFYSTKIMPYYPALDEETTIWLYIYNGCACFAIILYAAFLSGVSAKVSEQALQDENKSLSEMAYHDQLTGLLSRHSFEHRLDSYKQKPLVLVMGDIDDFKKINDTYGHLCGDYILHKTAQIARDICKDRADICRWGGEEFLFLFCSPDLKEIKRKIQELCDYIASFPFEYENRPVHITMTFGICAGSGEEEISKLIEAADEYMYMGKAQGKNRVISG